MPTLDGFDLTNVSTKNTPLPEDTYDCVIKEVHTDRLSSGGHPQAVVVSEIQGGEFNGRQIWDYLVLRQHDGKPNEISLKQLKRYYEAVLGKDEAARISNPNTDLLINGRVKLVLNVKPDNHGEDRNNVKRILPAA